MSTYGDLIQQSFGRQNPALPPVVGSIEEDPDKAARALELAKATGVPGTAIYGDLEEFERNSRTAMASEIVGGNPQLADFAQRSPLNPVVANDDWGTLDGISQKVSALQLLRPSAWAATLFDGDPLKRFREGGPLGSWLKTEDIRNYPVASAIAAGLGTPIELFIRGATGIQMTVADMAANLGSAMGAPSAGRDVAAMIESAGLTGRTNQIAPVIAPLEAYNRARPWVENGREPLAGALPEYDAYRAKQNAADLDALKEVTGDAQQSTLRERNPELFRDFIAQHTDAEIGISGEAVAALYGEKLPTPDDGLLGWVPGIGDKLALARETGGDVSVPLADWLARVEPQVLQALHDDIRVRPGNPTVREAALAAEPIPPPLPEEVPTVRAASALEPMFSVGDRRLKMERLVSADTGHFGPAQGFHDFQMLDEKGSPVGYINLSEQNGGKQIVVEMISGVNGLGPRDFGPALMRDLLRQLKAEFPNAETVTGHRVSGARERAGSFFEDSASPVIKLDNPRLEDFGELLRGGQWETYSPSTRAYIKPYAERSVEDRRLVDLVNEELDRIAPKKLFVQEADRLEAQGVRGQREGEAVRPTGTYIPYRDTYPIILYALEGPDPLGTARHEAIHHLRYYGFFDAKEWSVLERAANDLGWMDQFNIKERYPTLHHAGRLEEAIADAYKEWENGRFEAPTPEVQSLFERLKAFFDAIRERLRGMLGKEPTWEDIFQRVSTGEVGGREGVPIDPLAFDPKLSTKSSLPSIDDLNRSLAEAKRQSQEELTPEIDKRLRQLNRIIDSGGREAEAAMREKEEIVNRLPEQKENASAFDEDALETLRNEFVAMERSDESVEAHIDGVARVLKRYIAAAGRGEEVAQLIVRKGVEEVEKSGGSGEALGRDVINRFLSDLSGSDREFMEREFFGRQRAALSERLSTPEAPDGGSRVFERASALGMTVEQFRAYDRLIAKRHAEDIAAATKRASEEKARELTKQWREDRKALRQEVADDIRLRPDVAADLFFGAGELYGKKVPLASVKLDAAVLTDAQKAVLPRNYYGAKGVHPDDVAGLFGYASGDTMLAKLAEYNAAKLQAGMSAKDFVSRVIDIETDRQMRVKYGVLEDNIIDAVKEQVAGETQLDILHEETAALGLRAGGGPLDKATIQAQLREQFSRMSMSDARSDAYLRAAGKAGRQAELALLSEDPATAFRAKQQQYYATVIAGEAAKLEREAAKFDKLTKRLSRREVPQVEPEYLDYIHDLLQQAGTFVRRTPEEIAASKEHWGNGSLADFVAAKSGEGWDLAVTDRVAEGIGKRAEDMTVEEWREYSDAVTSLNHVGRAVRKIEIAGEKRDWEEFRREVIANIRELPARGRSVQNRWIYKIDASLTRMEEMVKDLDLRRELGPLFEAVIAPMMHSKSKEFDLLTDLSRHFTETRGEFGREWRKSLRKEIDQDVLVDPYTGAAYDMTRENLIQVMLNWGNRSNIEKFVAGAGMAKYGRRLTREEMGVFERQIKALIDQHATADDWKFVQRMWQPFKGWQAQMDTVSRNTSGVAPKWIPIQPVETPHGVFEGGYWPVKYDRLGSNLSVIEDRKGANADAVFGQNYFRAATAKGYLKERTGYVDFVDISTSLEQAAGTMQQTIHDIAFRDSLIQAGKVFYDKQIRAAIRKHYGAEYEAQLIPWLRRIAHQYSADDAAVSGINDFLRRVRINLVSHTLPFNLKVILSPDIGVPNPRAWATYLANRAENVALAMEKSEEIRHLVYNMDRDYNDALAKATYGTEIGEVRRKAVEWGFKPVAKVSQEFRVATFVDQYHKALGRGFPDAQAAKIADSYVRERHGAASVVDLPAVMQSTESMKMLTMFYGYFNTMYNWQRQMVGNARRGEVEKFMVNGLGSVVVGAAFGATLFNQRSKDDSWFKIIGKAMLMQPLATIPIVNLATNYAFEGYAPRIPFASMLTTAGNIISDSKKWWKGQRVEKPITHGANVVGLTTGLPLAQAGRTAQFASDVAQRRQAPRNIGEWARGIITGEAKLKK